MLSLVRAEITANEVFLQTFIEFEKFCVGLHCSIKK